MTDTPFVDFIPQFRAMLEESGWEFLSAGSDDQVGWFLAPNKTYQKAFYYDREQKRILDEVRTPISAVQVPYGHVRPRTNYNSRGEWKYHTYGHGDGPQPCIDDYRSDVGRALWKNYYVERDPQGRIIREGPAPFRSEDERKSYEELTGLHEGDDKDFGNKPHPYTEYFKRWPRLKEMFPEFANYGKFERAAEGKCNVAEETLPQAIG